jgi:uncharacterized surface protein with fasciclin (FAS1) repeats
MKKMNVLSLLMIMTIPSSCFGFQLSQTSIATSIASPSSSATTTTRLHSSLDGILNKNEDLLTVKNYLHDNYPALSKIVNLNDSIWKALGEGEGFTIFAPNTAAFASLGDTKQEQLLDERNVETTQKIAAYHVIAEVVTADDLFNSGGVLTLGGEIPVDRSVSGGMFGVGGKEDGGVLVNSAKLITSIELGSGVLHEVEGLVAPNILWRYMDQLRIPGSK